MTNASIVGATLLAVTEASILGAAPPTWSPRAPFGALTAEASKAAANADAHHPPRKRPPDPYIRDGLVTDAMEYPWTAKSRIPLFASPASRKQVGTLAPGDVVTCDRLQLRGHPWEVQVVYDSGPFRVGMRMWILERDMDEGSFEIWYEGKTRDDLAAAIPFGPSDAPCGPPSEQCYLRFAKEPKQEGWYRVETGSGTAGWTQQADDFRVENERRAPTGRK